MTAQEINEAIAHIDWDFRESKSDFLTHSLHAYPAKFIPQIPATFIERFSSPGATVIDPFCGSGTTLVEAVRLGRNAVGVDANPLAALVARVKSRPFGAVARLEAVRTLHAVDVAPNGAPGSVSSSQLSIFRLDDLDEKSLKERLQRFHLLGSNIDYVFFWFSPQAIAELLFIRELMDSIVNSETRDFLAVALSAIVIAASFQDSETRYTRRDKRLRSGDVLRKWSAKIREMLERVSELECISQLGRAEVYASDARDLSFLPVESIDLCVSSPPYPNAFTYNLYHRLRMIWLDVNPLDVKKIEIGSHRDYSRPRNGSTRGTFYSDMLAVLKELHRILRDGAVCAFVIGNSIIRGQKVDNSEVVVEAGNQAGFKLATKTERSVHLGRKSLNPAFGKIRSEHIVVLQKP